ncbi:MAG: riboflavin kinase [Patescibacteria group bacterium]
MIISGKVVKGSGLSTKKGFPTANINIRRKFPKWVSVAQAKVGEKTYPGILIVGAPTRHIRKFPKIEFFCFSQKCKFYGQSIEIKILKKIRGTKKFGTPKELLKQINQDIHLAKKYFKTHG